METLLTRFTDGDMAWDRLHRDQMAEKIIWLTNSPVVAEVIRIDEDGSEVVYETYAQRFKSQTGHYPGMK